MFRISYFDNSGKRVREHELFCLFWWVLSHLADFPIKTGTSYMGCPSFNGKISKGVIVKFWSVFGSFNFNDKLYTHMNFFVCFGEYYHPLLTFPSKLGHSYFVNLKILQCFLSNLLLIKYTYRMVPPEIIGWSHIFHRFSILSVSFFISNLLFWIKSARG